jgi:hypothetical protein
LPPQQQSERFDRCFDRVEALIAISFVRGPIARSWRQ